jgi:tetratricopeptide (TPR) repeat protein
MQLSKAISFLKIILATTCIVALASCMRSPEEKYADFMESGLAYTKQQDYDRAILQFKNAARVKPEEAEPHYQMALASLASGRWSELAVAIRTADRLNPRHLGAQLLLAQLTLQNGSAENVEAARERVEKVLEQSPDNSDALFVMAAAKERLGSPQDAEALLQEVLRTSPRHLSSVVALARMKLSRRDIAGAEAVLQQAAAQDAESPQPPVILGQFYLTLGRMGDAEDQFRRALVVDPQNAPALIGLAGLRLRAGHRDEAEQIYKEVASLPDKMYKPVYGQVLLQHGKVEEAIVEFRRLAEESPNDRTARSRLVAAYIMAQKTSEAERILTEAFEKNPKDTDALLQRAEIYFRSGKYPEAQDDLTKVLEYRPTSFEGRYLLAGVHGARKSFLLQKQELGEALRLNPNFLPARIDLAHTLLGENPRAALDLLSEAPESQQRTMAFVVARNWAHLAMGNRDEAREGIGQGLASARAPELVLQDGLLLFTEGKHREARASLQEVLRIRPEELRALRALAQSYESQQRGSATPVVQEHVKRNPLSASLQHFLGTWLLRAGDRAAAREAFERAKALDAGFVDADMALVRLDLTAKNVEQARTRLSRVLEAHPDNTDAVLLLALVAEADNRPQEAVDHYLRVVGEQPENYVALNNLAYRFAADERNLDEALKYAQKAKELAPDSASVDDTLGWVYYLKGVYQTALHHFQSASAKNESDPQIRYHLAMTHFKLGEIEEGRRVFDEAARLAPDAPEAAMARQVLAAATAP